MKITKTNQKFDLLFSNPTALVENKKIYNFLKPILKEITLYKDCDREETSKKICFKTITKEFAYSKLSFQQIMLIFQSFNSKEKRVTSILKLTKNIPETKIKNFHKLPFANPEERKQALTFLLDKRPYAFAEQFSSFGFSQEEAAENAKQIFEKHPEVFVENFQNFGITNQEEIVFYAFELAKSHSRALAYNLDHFPISNEDTLLQLLTMIATKNSLALISKFGTCHIKDSKKRFELAWSLLEKDPSSVLHCFQNFSALSFEERFSLAKEIIKKTSGVAWNFANFSIETEKERLELAELLIKTHPESAVHAFSSFDLPSEQTLRLAKLLVDTSEQFFPSLQSLFSSLQEEKDRIELARYLLDKNPRILAQDFKALSIKESEDRFIWAKKIAEKSPEAASRYFHNFDLKKEEERLETASIIAEKSTLSALQGSFGLSLKRPLPFLVLINSLVKKSLPGRTFKTIEELISAIFSAIDSFKTYDNNTFFSQYIDSTCSEEKEDPLFKEAFEEIQQNPNEKERQKEVESLKKTYIAYRLLKLRGESLLLEKLVSKILTTPILYKEEYGFKILRSLVDKTFYKKFKLLDLPEDYLIPYLFGCTLFVYDPLKQNDWEKALRAQESLSKKELSYITDILLKIDPYQKGQYSLIHFLTDTLFNLRLKGDYKKTLKAVSAILTCDPSLITKEPTDYSDQNHRFIIAKTLLQKYPKKLAAHISCFALSEPMRKEIALTLAKQEPRVLCEHIQSFSLSEPMREELALVLIKQHAKIFLAHIKLFAFSEPIREKMAWLLVKQDPWSLTAYIKSLDLSEPMREKIAIVLAKDNLNLLTSRFAEFEFSKEYKSSSFVLSIVEQLQKDKNALKTFKENLLLDNPPLDPWMLEVIQLSCGKDFFSTFSIQNPENLGDQAAPSTDSLKRKHAYIRTLAYFFPFDFSYLIRQMTALWVNPLTSKKSLEWVEEVFNSPLKEHPFFTAFFDSARSKIKDSRIREERLAEIKKRQVLYGLLTLFHGEENQGLQLVINKLETTVPTPDLRKNISEYLFNNLLNLNTWEFFKNYPKDLSIKMAIPYFMGSQILFDVCQTFRSQNQLNLEEALKLWTSKLKDYTTCFIRGNHMALLLNFLLKIEHPNSKVRSLKQQIVLNQTLDGDRSTLIERLRLLTVFCSSIDTKNWAADKPLSLVELQQEIKNYFIAKLHITLSEEEDFATAYKTQIQTMRDEFAFISYALNLQASSKHPQAVQALGKCITELLRGTFYHWRYQTPHLDILANQEILNEDGVVIKKHGALLEKWKQGDRRPLYRPFSHKFTRFLRKNSVLLPSKETLPLVHCFLTGELELKDALASAETVQNPLEKEILFLCGQKAGQNLNALFSLLTEESHLELKTALQEWQKKQEASLHIRNKIEPFCETFRDFLKRILIRDEHVANLELRMPLIHQFLTGALDLENALTLAMEKDSSLEKEILMLCKENTRQHVTSLLPLLTQEGDEQFKHDLEQLEKRLFAILPVSHDGWKLADTDDVSHLLLMGRETGGCLSIDTGFNKHAALANLADGKIRVLVVLNSANQIVGRALLRLMLNDHDQPVLLLERYYSLINDTALQPAILKYAKERAKALELPLVTKEFPSAQIYKERIHSKSSNAPFEYTDAGGGMTDGVYSIYHCSLLYDPAQKKTLGPTR